MIAVFVMLIALALVTVGIVVFRYRAKRRYDAVHDPHTVDGAHERSSMLRMEATRPTQST